MGDQTQKPRRIWRIVLILSLALNVAVLGVVGGALLRETSGKRPHGAFELSVGPLGRALTREDRRDVGRAIRERVDFSREGRPSPRRYLREIQGILVAEPFDPAALKAVVERSLRQSAQVQTVALDALIDRIAQMTPQERAAYAERLEQVRTRGN